MVAWAPVMARVEEEEEEERLRLSFKLCGDVSMHKMTKRRATELTNLLATTSDCWYSSSAASANL